VIDPTTVHFDEIVHGVTPANVAIRSLESGTAPPISQTCRSRRGVGVDCVSGNVRSVLLQPLTPLVPGEAYEAVVNPAGVTPVVVDRGANAAPATAQAFAAPTDLEQDSAALGYSWRTASNRRAFGRSYALERRAGASATFAFRGRSVTWYTATGPAGGRAAVWIDGRRVGLVDLYAPQAAFRVARTFGGLPRGAHSISIRVLGTSAPGATDTQVVVDAFETAGGRVANPTVSAAWATARVAGASRGRVAVADLAGSSLELTFRGTGVAWSTTRGPDHGLADVLVDGSPVLGVDTYARRVRVGVVREVSGLADGLHTLRIVVLGRGRPAARGTLVAIDRLVILG
jgi:bacillopeptidase F